MSQHGAAAASAGGDSVIHRVKLSKTPEEIKEIVQSIDSDKEASKAIAAILNWTVQELTAKLPAFSATTVDLDEELTFPIRKGLITIGMFARYAGGGVAPLLLTRVPDIVGKIVGPILAAEMHKDNYSVVGLKVEALACCTRLLQAFEDDLHDYLPMLLAAYVTMMRQYVDRLSSAEKLSPALTHAYASMVKQCTECVQIQYQISAEELAAQAEQLFLSACSLFVLVADEVTKLELAQLIHHLGFLAVPWVENSFFWILMVRGNNEDDEEEEEEHDDFDFLDWAINHSTGLTPPVWTIDPKKLSFSLLEKVMNEAMRLYEIYGFDIDWVPVGVVLSLCVGVSRVFFSPQEHATVTSSILSTILPRINPGEDLAKCFPPMFDLRACLIYVSQDALKPLFNQIYTGLQQLHLFAKSWIKSKNTKRAKTKYNKFRSLNITCMGVLIRCNPDTFFEHAESFFKETAMLFADPLLLGDFVVAVHRAADPKAKAMVEKDFLPSVMKNLFSELPKKALSWQIKSLMVESIGRIAYEVGPLFVPYCEDAMKILSPFVKEHNFDVGVEVLNTMAMILSGIKTCPQAEQYTKFLLREMGATLALDMNDLLPPLNEDSGDEEDQELDVVSNYQLKSLLLAEFMLKDPTISGMIGKLPLEVLQKAFNDFMVDVEREVMFEDDTVLKMIGLGVVAKLLQTHPGLQTQVNLDRTVASTPLEQEESLKALEALILSKGK